MPLRQRGPNYSDRANMRDAPLQHSWRELLRADGATLARLMLDDGILLRLEGSACSACQTTGASG
eukprot:14195246-Alexandrium_andersonii.AAC.1